MSPTLHTPAVPQRWAIYPHCDRRQPTGRGFVVRACNEVAEADDQYNYGGVKPVRYEADQPFVWRRRDLAEKAALRLSGLDGPQ